MSIDTETYCEEQALYMGRLANLGFVIWRETPMLSLVDRVLENLGRLEQEPGQGFAMMAVITANCAPIGADIRSAIDTGMRAYRDGALGMAAVIEVPGVFGGLTRAIARTMSVISRTPYPINTYGSVDDAAAWLPHIMGSRGASKVSQQQILNAILTARRMGA